MARNDLHSDDKNAFECICENSTLTYEEISLNTFKVSLYQLSYLGFFFKLPLFIYS
jgi:hypothetical protein